MDGRIHVEGIEEGVTGDSAYAGSGVYPDQGGLPSRGRPSDFGMWRPRNSTLGDTKEGGGEGQKGIMGYCSLCSCENNGACPMQA